MVEKLKAKIEKQAECIKELHGHAKIVEAKLCSHGQETAQLLKQFKTEEHESEQKWTKGEKDVHKGKCKPSTALIIAETLIAPSIKL